MARPTRIPLFPLDVVLLPAMPLPLHIFEPRYKTMIARCLDEKLEFGMILAANQAVATVGCTAEIVKKIRDYPDGRMDILTEGRPCSTSTELLDEKEYYEGLVEYLADEPATLDGQAESQLIRALRAMPHAAVWPGRGSMPATRTNRDACLPDGGAAAAGAREEADAARDAQREPSGARLAALDGANCCSRNSPSAQREASDRADDDATGARTSVGSSDAGDRFPAGQLVHRARNPIMPARSRSTIMDVVARPSGASRPS